MEARVACSDDESSPVIFARLSYLAPVHTARSSPRPLPPRPALLMEPASWPWRRFQAGWLASPPSQPSLDSPGKGRSLGVSTLSQLRGPPLPAGPLLLEGGVLPQLAPPPCSWQVWMCHPPPGRTPRVIPKASPRNPLLPNGFSTSSSGASRVELHPHPHTQDTHPTPGLGTRENFVRAEFM